MKLKALLLVISVFCSTILLKAQFAMHPMFNVGYVYQNQSFAEVGGKLLFLNNDNVLYRVGASALLGSVNEKFAVIPKFQGDLLFNFKSTGDIKHSYYYVLGAEATTKYIAPKIGLTLFGLFDLTIGYSFPYENENVNGKQLKGLNAALSFNVPLVTLKDLLK